MDDYEVFWSHEAIYDLADISEYIESEFGIERADRFDEDIDREGEALGKSFKFYTGTGIYYREHLIMMKPFSPSIIFYFVDEKEERVYIIRVLRHERDWQKLLRDNISYTFD
ncbi:MAG: type II toxin-antitoxin system RelE/ParE family toxin [Lachnospiraceae bacterium]|nr:type II toxin-antitoxin system RelE/ParE family toxin [Lachnospiraceae bacterium]